METNTNREHKSSVFSKLFGTPEILRELYSALGGVDVPADAIVDINTLSEVLYMEQINDLSFTIDDKIIVLIEHQSTINDNVPIRLLMYVARVYEKILDCENLYQKKLVKIPTPQFFVLYNGKEDYPDHKELRLSAAFKNVEGFTLLGADGLPLELVVQVYNINHGRNSEILAKSETLGSYSVFMGKVDEYKKELPLDKAIKAAVKYCIENDILKQFLREHASEVINMLTDNITVEQFVAIRCREAREDGREEGREEGRGEGRTERDSYFLELLDQGLSVSEIKQRLKQT